MDTLKILLGATIALLLGALADVVPVDDEVALVAGVEGSQGVLGGLVEVGVGEPDPGGLDVSLELLTEKIQPGETEANLEVRETSAPERASRLRHDFVLLAGFSWRSD